MKAVARRSCVCSEASCWFRHLPMGGSLAPSGETHQVEVAGHVLEDEGEGRALGVGVQEPQHVLVLQRAQRPQLPQRGAGQAV